jgi:hypothetical protein
MKPTVQLLRIHLPGQKVVLPSGPDDALDKIDVPSPLERYFGWLTDDSYDELTCLEYHSRYSVDALLKSSESCPDVCQPVWFANERETSVLCILNSVHPSNHKLFALRLLFRQFCDQDWKEVRSVHGNRCHTFSEAARQLGLATNQNNEARVCLQDAIELRRPPSDIRFLLAQIVHYGTSREELEINSLRPWQML